MPLTIPGRFSNRFEAGRALLAELTKKVPDFSVVGSPDPGETVKLKKTLKNWLVVAVPRGGVPVAAYIADALKLPLDVVLVKKLTPPDTHELGVGAIAEDGGLLVDEKSAREFGVTPPYIEAQRQRIMAELTRKSTALHSKVPALAVKDKNVLLVDDGMATGYTMRVAAEVLRRQGARSVVVAAPVASETAIELVQPEVASIVAAKIDPGLYAVGSHYSDFEPVLDSEVSRLLEKNREVWA